MATTTTGCSNGSRVPKLAAVRRWTRAAGIELSTFTDRARRAVLHRATSWSATWSARAATRTARATGSRSRRSTSRTRRTTSAMPHGRRWCSNPGQTFNSTDDLQVHDRSGSGSATVGLTASRVAGSRAVAVTRVAGSRTRPGYPPVHVSRVAHVHRRSSPARGRRGRRAADRRSGSAGTRAGCRRRCAARSSTTATASSSTRRSTCSRATTTARSTATSWSTRVSPAAVASLNDPYSHYFGPSDYQRVPEPVQPASQRVGIDVLADRAGCGSSTCSRVRRPHVPACSAAT